MLVGEVDQLLSCCGELGQRLFRKGIGLIAVEQRLAGGPFRHETQRQNMGVFGEFLLAVCISGENPVAGSIGFLARGEMKRDLPVADQPGCGGGRDITPGFGGSFQTTIIGPDQLSA